MSTDLPTEDQRNALAEMIAAAFIEIRALGALGKAQQASELADVFHNLPREILSSPPVKRPARRSALLHQMGTRLP